MHTNGMTVTGHAATTGTGAALPVRRVLAVEDSRTDAELIREHLDVAWPGVVTVDIAATIAAARRALAEGEPYDCVLLDLGLPDTSELYGLQTLVDDGTNAPIVVITARDDADLGTEAIRTGAEDYLPKLDLSASVLSRAIEHAVERYRQRLEVAHERKQAEHALRQQSLHDPLTGLANRVLLRERVAAELTKASRRPGSVALAFVDLDCFKLVNDSMGHSVGDGMLLAIGRRIVESVRPTDTVARFGGDEYIVLLHGLAGAIEAKAIAERVHAAVTAPIELDGRVIVPAASIGIAVAAARHHTADELIRDADRAMYRAKARGKDRVVILDELVEGDAAPERASESTLRRALDDDRLALDYQPIFALAGGQLIAAEALVRLIDDDGQRLMPVEFLPLAEQTGLIERVGRWVVGAACRQAARWRRGGADVAINVNAAAHELVVPGLGELVGRLLCENDLPAGALTIEVSERALADYGPAIAGELERLKANGVGLSIENVGLHGVPLNTLRGVHADSLKIDRALVARVADGADEFAVARAIAAFGAALELATIATGVETADQAEAVRLLGFTMAQGYYYGEPQPPEALATLLG